MAADPDKVRCGLPHLTPDMTRKNALGQPIGAPLDVTLPRPLPPHTPMQGRYCAVVPLSADHAPALHAAFSQSPDGQMWTYMPTGPFTSRADYAVWVEAAIPSRDPLFHTILDANGTPLGTASYLRIDPVNGCIEVGWIAMSPALQRTRISTEAMFLMMTRAMDQLGYRRYEWKCDSLNAPSRAAALRLGFQYEGTFRQATHYKGRNRDTAWFALTDKDWPAIRAEFTRWLDPSNFDEAGQQKTPLRHNR